ncbi:MAG: type II CRISPR-associated endonuclease Cas1 [Massilibacteroides sp.]|nr:type II CRISPR-associated endonuclease Cas1 [Massilibacteroides sp.]
MIKKTLCFSHPAYLSVKHNQLVIELPKVGVDKTTENKKRTIPIEDIGVVVLEHHQITITHNVLRSLLAAQAAIITCDIHLMPQGLLLPLDSNTTQNERFRHQLKASQPLLKQLWQQTIQHKIYNQAITLRDCATCKITNMLSWASNVKSGDPENLEARAAVYYWRHLFTDMPYFVRGQEEEPPNQLLNYGYAILRATVARSLVISGLLPTLGIHHHNKYNAYCLADDIMEPYRPYVDRIVVNLKNTREDWIFINPEIKRELLGIPVVEVNINGKRRPLMLAVSETTASLAKCFSGEARKITYPEM